MDEKDKQIERLFDDYASSIKPNERLADKAIQTMRTERVKPKSKRTAVWISMAASCAAVLITVVSVVSFYGYNGGEGGGSSLGDASGDFTHGAAPSAPEMCVSYVFSELRAESADRNIADNYINTAVLNSMQTTSESYLRYYYKDTAGFVGFKAELEIAGEQPCKIEIFAENMSYKCAELSQKYAALMTGAGYAYNAEYSDGAYVTLAYCEKKGFRYYAQASSGGEDAHGIIAEIIGVDA